MIWGERLSLQLLWLVPLLAGFLMWAARRHRESLRLWISPAIAPRILLRVHPWKRGLKAWLFLAAIALLCLAAARPQWGTKMETVTRRGVDVVIAVDTSLSMDVPDVVPNRLEKAKHLMGALIDRLEGDRVGVVAFAGSAFVQCPLTLDHGAARMFLDIINTRTIPLPGTDLGAAIRTAAGAFRQQEQKYKVLVLLTDGEDHEGDFQTAAEEAKKAGVVIHTVGIGTAAGQPIPLLDQQGSVTGYKKGDDGQVVVSRLDDATLAKIASTTGGKFYFATAGESEVEDLYGEIGQMDKREMESKRVRSYEEQFQYFLAAALALLLGEMFVETSRRGLS